MVLLSVRNEMVLFRTAQRTTQVLTPKKKPLPSLFGPGESNPVLLSSRKGGQKILWEAVTMHHIRVE
jgi:hypothetical protein